MSSESRKPEQKTLPPKRPVAIDPVKLGMVSDYLKKTVSERPYAFILESLAERLETDKVDRKLLSVGIIPVPVGFDFRKLATERTVAFMPYCSKPFDCPSNTEHGRKSIACQATEGQCDHTGCTIGRFVAVAKKLGVQEFHVIDSDSGLFKWLAKKHEEGFTHVIGVACEFAVSYALEVIHGQLGFNGIIITINGDKCKTKEEYAESDAEDRDRLTFIDEWTITTLDDIATQLAQERRLGKGNGNAVADK